MEKTAEDTQMAAPEEEKSVTQVDLDILIMVKSA
jgi:signal recognition particle subunit SRP68